MQKPSSETLIRPKALNPALSILLVLSLALATLICGCGEPAGTSANQNPAATTGALTPADQAATAAVSQPQPGSATSTGQTAPAVPAGPAPVFSLSWSEYPSWSAFGVAGETGIIDGKEGSMGEVEKKWGIDIVLKEADYEACMVMYGSGNCDAVCITNMDILNPSLSKPSVAILPTSTSHGADACIVAGTIPDAAALRGKKVYGLSKTVSEYCFVRNLEILGEKETDHLFTNMDPGAAAMAMQQSQEGYEAIVVWNPFVLETLNKRTDTKVLFDSTSIPGEIVDMVVMGEDSLKRPGGDNFACAVAETFYRLCARMEAPDTGNDTLMALGEKFSHLNLESMKKVVEQTRFYKSAAEGLKIFNGEEFKSVMDRVVKFCVSHQIVDREPVIAFGAQGSGPAPNLRFDPSFMEKAAK